MDIKKDLIFEIGTEELPPGFIDTLSDQIKNNILKSLNENEIPFNESAIKTFSTPRRIAFYIPDLPEETEIKEIEIKGPPKNKAFDLNNNPTEIAIGFSKKYNQTPDKLIVKKVNEVEYIFIKHKKGGTKVLEELKTILEQSLKSITGEKLMKWGDNTEKFVRPLRWILAIFGEEIIDFSYANLKSSNKTFGHRFIKSGELEIKDPKEYIDKLRNNNVIALKKERKKEIEDLLEKKIKELKKSKSENFNSMVETVTSITEYPGLVECTFEKDFLKLPSIVIETVLEKHQKYFVLKEDNELSNVFLVITNGTEQNSRESKKHIIKGNEKVAKARLNDAIFFYAEDQKRPFTYEERIKDLEKITYQKEIGSMKNKIDRIVLLSKFIYENINKGRKLPIDIQDILETAKLCKLDLTTQMVFEMPELQGIIGSIYAHNCKYKEVVCNGIKEHYLSTSAKNLTAQIVGIADKLDNLFCLFSINKIPTSSSDPFALRGQTQWILNVVDIIQDTYNLEFNLSEIIDLYPNHIQDEKLKKLITAPVINSIKNFISERLKQNIHLRTGSTDIAEAVFSVSNPLANTKTALEKILFLKSRFENPSEEDKNFLIAAKRLVRIVDDSANGSADLNLLKIEDEKILLNLFKEIENKKYSSSEEYFETLKKLTSPINSFFDNILVNDPDPKIKQARHSLLKKGKTLFEKIGDFNLIVERS